MIPFNSLDYSDYYHWIFVKSLVLPSTDHRDALDPVLVLHCPEFHFVQLPPLICLFSLLAMKFALRSFEFEPVLMLAV